MQYPGSESELVEVPEKFRHSLTFKFRRQCFTLRCWLVAHSTTGLFNSLAAEDTVARHIGDHGLFNQYGSGVLAYPGTFGSRQTGQRTQRSTRAMVSSAASLLLSSPANQLFPR
jgi:hypothetical protein